MPKFTNQKTYAIVCGSLMFCFGIVGFAFKTAFNIADKYLFLSLLLGFWGIICYFA